ncbi:MAG TPA: hypothetical protein VED17_11665 [Nitrososphaerales archaeon]|nr:hypothetical protein [Nitrososphaerales archaeon]
MYVYAGLEEKEEALDWLEKAYAERSIHFIGFFFDPMLSMLWEEPRWKAIIEKTGLNEYKRSRTPPRRDA